MPTASERYNFPKVEEDGQSFVREIFKQCKKVSVEEVKLEDIMKIGNKDVIAKHIARSYS